MFPLIGGLMSGAASLVGSIFQSQTSAQNTQQQLQAQAALQQQSEGFNAEQADLNRAWNADQAAVGREFNASQADIARSFNSAEAQKTRDFQAASLEGQQQFEASMSNTAYQRAVADMKAAGLNPAMMFGSGGASSTPSVGAAAGATASAGAASSGSASGSAASVGTPSVPMPTTRNALAGLGDAVDKAVNTAISVKQFDKMSEEIANIRTQEAKIAAETVTEKERPGAVRASTLLTQNEAEQKGLTMPAAELAGVTARDVLAMPEWLRRAAVEGGFLGNKVGDVIAPFVSSAGAAAKFRDRFGSW